MNEEQEMDVKIEASWKAVLKDELGQDYFKALREFVKGEYQHAIVSAAEEYIPCVRAVPVRAGGSRDTRARPVSWPPTGQWPLLRRERGRALASVASKYFQRACD